VVTASNWLLTESAMGVTLASWDVVDSKKLSGWPKSLARPRRRLARPGSYQSCFRRDKPEAVSDTAEGRWTIATWRDDKLARRLLTMLHYVSDGVVAPQARLAPSAVRTTRSTQAAVADRLCTTTQLPRLRLPLAFHV
jgi:hypothetical protein